MSYQNVSNYLIQRFFPLAIKIAIMLFFYFVIVNLIPNVANGSTNSWYGESWSRRMPINIDKTKLKSYLIDYPVYINLSSLGNDFFASVQPDGRDIRITNADGITELPFDLVSIDKVNKTGELHFKADIISPKNNTKFYIYFGNKLAVAYSSSSTYGSSKVWSDYNSVYHLEKNGEDSSSNKYDLLPNNFPKYGSSKIGRGLNLGATNTVDGLRSSDNNFGFTNSLEMFHVSAWIKTKAQPTDSEQQVVFNRIYAENPSSQTRIDYVYVSPDVYMIQQQVDYQYTNNLVKNLNINDWYKLDIIQSTSTALFYLNGILVSTSSLTGVGEDLSYYKSELTIGVQRLGESGGFKGDIDEVRIMRGKYRSPEWIFTEYYNQLNQQNFYKVGNMEYVLGKNKNAIKIYIINHLLMADYLKLFKCIGDKNNYHCSI